MFKKFNWGHGIFVFYVFFVGAVLTALIASFGVDHSLVVDDYYAQDLDYQRQYSKIENNMETNRIIIDNNELTNSVTVNFIYTDIVDGSINFYRPSDKSKDFQVALKNKETVIPTVNILPGKWILKIDWIEEDIPYYTEEMIYI
jgi:hypothetical protein